MTNVVSRTFNEVVNDVKLFQQAKTIREWLSQISGLIPRLNEEPNGFYGDTQDGLVLIEYYGGPSKVGTPLGEWSCTGGGSCKPEWLKEAKARLGLVMIQEEIVTVQGCYGPVWGITKDLDGNELPTPKWNLSFLSVAFNTIGAINAEAINASDLRNALIENKVENQDNPNWLYNETWQDDSVYADMAYHYKNFLFNKLKAQIQFVAWDD